MVLGESLSKKERESIRLTILTGRAVLCSPSLNFNMPWWHLRVIIMETNVCVRACILVRVFIYSGQSACEVCICWSVWSFHSWPRNTSRFVHTNALCRNISVQISSPRTLVTFCYFTNTCLAIFPSYKHFTTILHATRSGHIKLPTS